MPCARGGLRIPSEQNAAVAARSHYPPRPQEPVDWSCRLYDSDGHEHVLIDLGAQQLVTKVSFAYVVWERRSGRCISHFEAVAGDVLTIRNQPLTDVERHRREVAAQEALRRMYPADDPRLEHLQQARLRER